MGRTWNEVLQNPKMMTITFNSLITEKELDKFIKKTRKYAKKQKLQSFNN
jgi:hypothetical protein